MGVLERYNVEMIGAAADAIDKAEDRALFREAMPRSASKRRSRCWPTPPTSRTPTARLHEAERGALKERLRRDLDAALDALETQWNLGEGDRKQRYISHAMAMAPRRSTMSACPPSSARPSPWAAPAAASPTTAQEFFEIVERGLDASPTTEVLIEESVLGWKEYEMEVVRDKADNCIIICSIENIDPMGVHTGDSITVAPALTLTDKEYQIMRNASIAVLREIGVETGGSNVQFAVNPETAA
jgi:carbamoyl-phosphate synthase large subunit